MLSLAYLYAYAYACVLVKTNIKKCERVRSSYPYAYVAPVLISENCDISISTKTNVCVCSSFVHPFMLMSQEFSLSLAAFVFMLKFGPRGDENERNITSPPRLLIFFLVFKTRTIPKPLTDRL